jgi:hypothetical protein
MSSARSSAACSGVITIGRRAMDGNKREAGAGIQWKFRSNGVTL